MSLKPIVIASFCLIFFLNIASEANDARPTVPYVEKNICPFECCMPGKWVAKTALTIYKKEGDHSAVAFTAKPGEQLTAIKGNVHIVKLGIVKVKKSFYGFTEGDKVYLLSYRGEGAYDLWYKGKVSTSGDEFWPNVVLIQQPKLIWWVFVKNKDNRRGWLELKEVKEGNFGLEEKIASMDCADDIK